jgi:hypothetical protein
MSDFSEIDLLSAVQSLTGRSVRPLNPCTHHPIADVDDNGVVSIICTECPFGAYMSLQAWMEIQD